MLLHELYQLFDTNSTTVGKYDRREYDLTNLLLLQRTIYYYFRLLYDDFTIS